jgi:DNA-binding transcriptional MerR regulator
MFLAVARTPPSLFREGQLVTPTAQPDLGTLMQIGDVAERTGLSLRTIRHYEEVGLLPDTQRSQGGFRLYTQDAVSRLLVVKQMKPLDFTLEEMRELIELRERLTHPKLSAKTRATLTARLEHYRTLSDAKLAELEGRLRNARAFADTLGESLH